VSDGTVNHPRHLPVDARRRKDQLDAEFGQLAVKAFIGTACFALLAILLIVAALMSGGPQ